MKPQYESFNKWIEWNYFKYAFLETEVSTENQLWSLLDIVSEVSEYRKNLLALNRLSKDNIRICSPIVQSFIRQAKRYWTAARQVESPSNALLYYYSFLNLVKAYLVSKDHIPIVPGVYHGIKTQKDFNASNYFSNTIIVGKSSNRSVFANYYELVYSNNYLKSHKYEIKLLELLRMCESIELETYSVTRRSSLLTHYKIICDETRGKNHRLVFQTDDGFNLSKIPKAEKYLKDFTLQKYAHRMLDIEKAFPSMRKKQIDLYFGPEFDPSEQDNQFKKFLNVFEQYIGPTYSTDTSSGIIYLPIRARPITTSVSKMIDLPVSQDHAIYLVMFFLSELVRYRPNFLDGISDQKEYWLLCSFLDNCPNQFLKAITNRILNQNFIIEN